MNITDCAVLQFLLQLELLVLVQRVSQLLGRDWEDIKLTVSAGVIDALSGLGVEEVPKPLLDLLPSPGKDGEEAAASSEGMNSFQLSVVNFYLKIGQVRKSRCFVRILLEFQSMWLSFVASNK